MASPEKLAPLPETLPDDFSEWDGEAPPEPSLGKADPWEAWEAPHPNGKAPKPLGQSDDRDALLPPVVERPRVSGSGSSATVFINQQNDLTDWESERPAARTPAPAPTPAPVVPDEWEAFGPPHSNGKASSPLGPPTDRDAILPPVVDKRSASGSAAPGPVVVKKQNDPIDRVSERPAAPEPAAAPAKHNEWEAFEAPHSNGKAPKPPGQSAERAAIAPPVLDKPRVSSQAAPAPNQAKPQRASTDWASKTPSAPAPATTPTNRNEWEAFEAPHSNGKAPKPLGQSADRSANLPPAVDKPRVSASAALAPDTAKPQKSAAAPVEVIPGRVSHTPVSVYPMDEVPIAPTRPGATNVGAVRTAPEPAATAKVEAQEGHFPSFQSLDAEAEVDKNATKKKWMIIAAVSVCSMVLLLVIIGMVLQHGTKHVAKQPVEPPPAVTDSQQDADPPAPVASDPVTQKKPPATPQKQDAADHQPDKQEEVANSTQAQTKMMNDQLTAPTQIPHGINQQAAENGPPPDSFGSVGAESLGGNDVSSNVFNAQAKPDVKPLKPIVVSAGVVEGMLIQKSPPIYPTIARSARVSGTVKLEATISKTGTIKNLRVVSGPEMLRSAAVDAVRTWRYKPYKLNNEPVEIESAINVIFSLGQ